MTNEEVLRMYEDLRKHFPNAPDFEHFPKTFAYYVKLYKHFVLNK